MSLVELKVPDIGGHENVDIIAVEIKVGDSVAVEQTLITLETDKATMDVPAEAAGVIKEVKVKVGDKISEGGVIAVEVKAGDTIALDQTLITLETDKATMDVPADAAGVVQEVKIKVGDKVSEGSVILTVETGVAAAEAPAQAAPAATPAAAAPAPAAPAAPAPAAKPAPAASSAVNEAAFSKAHAGPSTRKLARELGVDLGSVKGSGQKGRITAEDVKSFVKGVLQSGAGASLGGGLNLLPWPKVDFSKFGEVEVKELSRIKKISGQNLSRNWIMIPHVTVNEEADMTELEEFRKALNKEWEKAGVKVSPLAFIIKASVTALKAFPEFNSSLDGDNLVLKKYYNIGFAADTPNGLVVPVIKDVDKKGLKEISQELTELSKKAREGKLKPQEMQGACFTISSLGGIGGTGFTPIVNAPEVAILGVCKSQIKPVWNGKEFEPRLMCPLSLSFDHRVIDGAAGMRFTVFLANLLKDFRRVVL